jgi:HSP20 family protein
MNTMTFDPFGDIERLTNGLNQALREGPRSVPVDLFRDGDQYVLSADLPGADPSSIDVDLDGNLLTIRADRTSGARGGAQWLVQERRTGSYARQFTLGDGVDSTSISATYENGVLTLVIPLNERAKPRKINVESTGGKSSISA